METTQTAGMFEPAQKLHKDILETMKELSREEVRFLVDSYYQRQDERIRENHRKRIMEKGGEQIQVLSWLADQSQLLEDQLKRALKAYVDANPLGVWLTSICGVGPVIAAGLISHVDFDRTGSCPQLWSFAGLDPSKEWLGRAKSTTLVNEVMGEDKKVTMEHVATVATRINSKLEDFLKRIKDPTKIKRDDLIAATARIPWNASLKRLCYLAGESFVKVQNNENDTYGKKFAERKAHEIMKNLRGDFADQVKTVGKSTDAYQWYSGAWAKNPDLNPDLAKEVQRIKMREEKTKSSKKVTESAVTIWCETKNPIPALPPAHVHARARRWAVKLFLAHFFEVGYFMHHGKKGPEHYVFSHLGHKEYIPPPNLELVRGW